MARNLLICTIAALILLMGGCTKAGVYLQIIDGNYEYSRGDYKEANFTYIQALKKSLHTARITYNLGNVYHSLGESEAALEEWELASLEEEDPELRARIAFNRGVIYYELGMYQQAYSEFRRVLKLDPDDIEAKANLEYCLRKLNLSKETQETKQDSEEDRNDRQLSEDGKRILEYVRRSSTSILPPDYRVEDQEEGKDW